MGEKVQKRRNEVVHIPALLKVATVIMLPHLLSVAFFLSVYILKVTADCPSLHS